MRNLPLLLALPPIHSLNGLVKYALSTIHLLKARAEAVEGQDFLEMMSLLKTFALSNI